jgi:hypothetical protein
VRPERARRPELEPGGRKPPGTREGDAPLPLEGLAVADPALRARSLARLQRTAGNAAVQQLVAGARLQRYEAGEHAQFGGSGPVKLAGVKPADGKPVTEGDIIALGDLYESADAMMKADKGELAKLIELVHRDRDHYEKGVGKAVSNDEWEDATKGRPEGKRYLDLAAKNAAHFAAPSGTTGFAEGDTDNRSMWFKNFKKAIKLAQDKKMDEAYVVNAFADHFLTDAFSAGHLINKAATIEKAHKSPAKDKKEQDKDPRIDDEKTRVDFEKRIAKAILADSKGAVLMGYEARTSAWDVALGGGWKKMTVDTLAGVIDMIWYHETDKFFSMFVRAVHDRLNKDIDTGSGGVEVMNKAGDGTWKLSGDETLGKSPKTLEIGKKAAEKARQTIADSEGKKKVDYEAAAQAIWNFVPSPTAAGQKQIDDAEKDLLDPKRAASSDAWVVVALDNFDTLLKQLTDKNLIRLVPKAAPKPTPVPSPAH